jgi:predicted phosphodiesterase
MLLATDKGWNYVQPNEYIAENYLEMSDREIGERLGLSTNAVEKRRKRMGLSKSELSTLENDVPLTTDESISAIAKLLQERGVDAKEIGNVSQAKFSAWGDPDNPKTSTSVVIKMSPTWDDGPEWPVVQQAAPKTVKPFNVAKIKRDVKWAIVYPDPQIGYRMDSHGNLDPFHDEQAMAVGLAISKDVNPDKVINLGDFEDFAPFSRFAQEASFAMTTQHGLDRGHEFLAEQVSAATSAEDLILFEGNHDRRLQNMIEANALGAFGLQQAKLPESWPVLSLPHLLRLDELGFTYIDGYPAGEYWINERLRCEHGNKVGKAGTIAKKIIEDERVSVITGHTHHLEFVSKTMEAKTGPKVNAAYTMGCLCRIDGAVPSTNSSTDVFGKPMKSYENWQQAVGVVEYVDGDGWFNVHTVLIHEGEALFNGKLYKA